MKKVKTMSKMYIPYVVMIFIALGCLIASLCMCDYSFEGSFAEIWQANTLAFVLFGVCVALNLVFIVTAIVLRVKNDEVTRGQVALAFQIAVVITLEVVLCVPIFIVWVIEKIHDAVSSAKNEKI